MNRGDVGIVIRLWHVRIPAPGARVLVPLLGAVLALPVGSWQVHGDSTSVGPGQSLGLPSGYGTSVGQQFTPPASAAVLEAVTTQSSTSFAGISDTGTFPSDTEIAVGPTHVFEMVNARGTIFTKSGVAVSSFALSSFFQAPSGYGPSNSRIVYDPVSQHWFATTTELQNGGPGNALVVSRSASSDPTGGWSNYTLFSNTTGAVYGNPRLGVSGNVVITDNDSGGMRLTVIDEPQLLACCTISYAWWSPNPAYIDTVPTKSGAAPYVLAVHNRGWALDLFRVVGNPSAGVVNLIHVGPLPITPTVDPGAAPQQGDSDRLSTGGTQLTDALVDGQGFLWAVGTDACNGVACTRIIQMFDPWNTATLWQDQDISPGNGMWIYYPAIAVDRSENVFVVAEASSASMDLSMVATDFSACLSGANCATQTSMLGLASLNYSVLASGQGPYDAVCAPNSGCVARVGDYSGAAVDPSQTCAVWLASDYSTNTNHWQSYIGEDTDIALCH